MILFHCNEQPNYSVCDPFQNAYNRINWYLQQLPLIRGRYTKSAALLAKMSIDISLFQWLRNICSYLQPSSFPDSMLFASSCQISFWGSQLVVLLIFSAPTHILPCSVLSESAHSFPMFSWLGEDVTLYQVTHKFVHISRSLKVN